MMRSKGEAVSEVAGFLSNVPLFSKLSEASALSLARECRFKQVEIGELGILTKKSRSTIAITRTKSEL
ncbi:MAG: hypothetical protein ABI904_01820 [Chloroflexota bacterium]